MGQQCRGTSTRRRPWRATAARSVVRLASARRGRRGAKRAWLVPTASAQAKSKIEEAFAGAKTMGPSTVSEEVVEPFELDGCVPRCDPRGEPSPSTPRCASSMMTRMRRGSPPAGTGTCAASPSIQNLPVCEFELRVGGDGAILVDCDDRQRPSATIGNGHRQRSAAAIGSRWMSHLMRPRRQLLQLAQLGSKQWSCPRTVLPISVGIGTIRAVQHLAPGRVLSSSPPRSSCTLSGGPLEGDLAGRSPALEARFFGQRPASSSGAARGRISGPPRISPALRRHHLIGGRCARASSG